MNIKFSLFALALVNGVQSDTQLRGRELANEGYNEKIDKCKGAVCQLWGDPHFYSCDQQEYDCQAVGLVTFMKNHVFDIQGNLVPVGGGEVEWLAKNRVGRFNYGATFTNDIAIDVMPSDESVPTFQLGFGNVNKYVDEKTGQRIFPSETGCNVGRYYKGEYIGFGKEPNLMQCRDRCERHPRCDSFNYWADHACTLRRVNGGGHEHSDPSWGRTISGSMDSTCGLPPPVMPIEEQETRMKHGIIGESKGCPLLFHVNGEMKDISKIDSKNGYLYGGINSDTSVQMTGGGHQVIIRHKISNNSWAEAKLRLAGKGPGELWSCHWNLDVCLPESDKEQFKEESVGLLGTPNGDKNDEFHDRNGNKFDIEALINQYKRDNPDLTDIANKERAWLDYCYDNWCVDKKDAIMVPPPGQELNDILCQEKIYADPEPACIMTDQQVEAECGEMVGAAYDACRMECCNGSCDEAKDELRKLSNPEEPNTPEITPPAPVCNNDTFERTSETACPELSSTPVVKLLSSPSPPEDSVIIYDINPNAGNDDFRAVSFKVNNPFDSETDIYVKHEEDRLQIGIQDSKCSSRQNVESGCDNEAPTIEVACRNYDNVNPFALVKVYFVSEGFDFEGVDDSLQVDKCCADPELYDYNRVNVIAYTFEIQCSCPEDSATPE